MKPSRPRLTPRSWLRWPRRTARLRFTAVYSSLFLLSGAALVAATCALFQRATEYKKPRLPPVPQTPAIHQVQLGQLPKALATLAYDQGQLAKDHHQLAVSFPQLDQGPPRLAQAMPGLVRDQNQLAQDQRQLAQAVKQLAQAVHQVTQAGSVQAAQRAADSHQLLVDSGIALGFATVLALLAGWVVAGRMLRPIRTITRTARRISSASLHERLALKGPEDELKELADTLDDLFERLDAAFEAQRHFVANASHELRTPITRERALVQVALGDPSTPDVWRSTGHQLLASNREQETLIEALLTLASSEGGLDYRERTDLADICRAVVGGGTEYPGLHLHTSLAPASADGDPRLLERLVANLVDNAVKYNVVDGRVQVSTGVREGRAVLSVTNTGPIVPASDVSRLFQPFQRLDGRGAHNKNGHGLGLSIVRAIATAHGAVVTATSLPSGGLAVVVTFPPSHQ